MNRYLSAFALLFFLAINSNAQSITQLIQAADTLLKNEAYESSLKIRNKIIARLGTVQTEQYVQQKYKQQLTEARLAETPALAVEKTKIALRFFNQLKNKALEEQIDLYSLLYHSLAYNGQNEESLRIALLSYQNVNKIKAYQGSRKIDLIYDIGFLYSRLNNYFEAINYYKKSLSLYIRANGEVNNDVALNYNNLAYAYNNVYNQKYTIAYYRKAALIWEKVYANNSDTNDYLITVYQNLNAELVGYGALDDAKAINAKLNNCFAKKYGNTTGHKLPGYYNARKLMVLSNVRTRAAIGDFQGAIKYCDSLMAETKFTKDNKSDIGFVVNCYSLVSDYTYDNKDYSQTIQLCTLIAGIAEKYDLTRQKMIINAKLGTTYEKLKKFEEAFYHIELADQNVDKESFNSSKFSIQLIRAKILQGQGANEQALIQTKNTIEQILFEKKGKKVALNDADFSMIKELASEDFINLFVSGGHLYLDVYQKTKKKGQLQTAEKLLNLAAQLFQEYYLKGEFNELLDYYHQRINEGLLTVLSLKNASFEDKINTLNLIERNASQHLLKEYDKKVRRSNAENSDYLDRISSLKLELAYYQEAGNKESGTSKLNKSKQASIKRELDLLTKKIAETEKNYNSFNASHFSVNDVLLRLNDDEQLLKYYVTENRIFSVLIGKDSIGLKGIKRGPVLEQQLERFIEQTKLVASDFKQNASNLYPLLLPSSLKRHITIIPDNFLNYVPFETLYDRRTKQYLVQQNVVAYDYSLPMWLLHQDADKSYGTLKLAAFSPDYSGQSNKSRDADFKTLKFAGLEAATIASLFQGDLFQGAKATKHSFLKRLGEYSIFHLSMHSQLFEDDFNRSFLLFENNEKLYFSELYGMNIPAYMVVLSACNTGNGLLRKGEGIMSMSRALTYAGVKSAVVSLWQVPDKETSEIMVSFYQNLKKGQSKAEALANAKTKFINENPIKNHPFYWAGFVVNGDVSAIYNHNTWWYIAFASISFLGVLAIFFRKRLVKIGK